MKNEHKKNLDRRDFLKVLGGAAAVTSATLLPGCKNKQESAYTATTDIPTDQMTYRINPSTQDRVSLLGYGCMRWPTVSNNSARDSSDDIDQETVNKLVDVAIAHGVIISIHLPPIAKAARSGLPESPSAAIRETNISSPRNYRISRPRLGAGRLR